MAHPPAPTERGRRGAAARAQCVPTHRVAAQAMKARFHAHPRGFISMLLDAALVCATLVNRTSISRKKTSRSWSAAIVARSSCVRSSAAPRWSVSLPLHKRQRVKEDPGRRREARLRGRPYPPGPVDGRLQCRTASAVREAVGIDSGHMKSIQKGCNTIIDHRLHRRRMVCTCGICPLTRRCSSACSSAD